MYDYSKMNRSEYYQEWEQEEQEKILKWEKLTQKEIKDAAQEYIHDYLKEVGSNAIWWFQILFIDTNGKYYVWSRFIGSTNSRLQDVADTQQETAIWDEIERMWYTRTTIAQEAHKGKIKSYLNKAFVV